ncbi:C-X-C motif chemokine 9 [Fundulus heteroclitus]|uniref:C-X-C motif chemokine 9 n=1 Tax=Fundulus heteroclitus TaxID=8078 RepID=UPI00165AD13F|nr:C-X-C motif chemokine 9 [Fundulus heteroclitus]
MALNLQAVCQLAFLSLCCLLTAVRETDGTYVPGRCLCPETIRSVRGQLSDLKIYHKSATCSSVTVIVTLKRTNSNVCLNPEAPLGKQLLRCWNRAQKLGRDVKVCLRRRRRRGGQSQRLQQKARRHARRGSSSRSN